MTTSITDVANMALVTIGKQKQISALTQDSAEAKVINTIITLVQSWCFGLTNWNFARNTAVLSLTKGPPGASPPSWSSTYPSPPWLYEYLLPTDFIRALYVTNSGAAATAGYLGEPQRFALGVDTISATQQEVLFTNQPGSILIYTSFITNPTIWPWYFLQLAVLALAQAICMSLTGNLNLFQEISQALEQQIYIATQANVAEGLIIQDTTPEWIQALGINYPYRRLDGRAPPALAAPPRGKSSDQ